MAIRMRRNKATLPISTGPPHHSTRRMDHLIRKWFASSVLLAILLIVSFYFAAPFQDIRILQNIETFDYDVIIIGSGPAGLTSALYTARSGWSVLVLGSLNDSVLAEATSLDNLPGVPVGTKGIQWLESTKSNLAFRKNIAWAQPSIQATGLQAVQGGGWKVQLGIDRYALSRAIVIASGSVPRRLQLPHEEELWGKAVHSCAVCDGPAYGASDTVVVVGGGDAAVDAALFLQRTVKQVILVHRRKEFRSTNRQNLNLLRERVQIEAPFVVSKYELSKGKLVGVTLTSPNGSGTAREIKCEGVFLLLGSTPNTGFVGNALNLDEDGYVVANAKGEASAPGAFVAGDVVDRYYHQAVTAAGDGAQAALNAEDWLRKNTRPVQVTNIVPILNTAEVGAKKPKQPQAASTETGDKGDYGEGCDLTNADCIKTIIHKYPVVMFSKPWCPFCKKALEIFTLEGAKPHVINLVNSDSQEVQATLATLSNGRRTVPNVFINGRSVGGGDDIVDLHRKQKLKSLLIGANALAS